ncbi:MAG: guanylate kinase [Planctomycetota bacterium]|jgi:guanylate kinase
MSRQPDRHSGLLVAISGPSGAGKTTIAHEVERRLGGVFSISATTRPRSQGEVDGREYHFLTEARFREMVDRGLFLEHAQVYGTHWYGTPREPVECQLAEGRLVILDIDVHGALQVKRAMPDAFALFILPPSEQELLCRLRRRGRDDEASIQRRFNAARREIELGTQSGAYDAHIFNEDLERAVEDACRLVRQRRAARET